MLSLVELSAARDELPSMNFASQDDRAMFQSRNEDMERILGATLKYLSKLPSFRYL